MCKKICPLCGSRSRPFHRSEKHSFFRCEHCQGLFRSAEQMLSPQKEKDRYLLHQNHGKDQGYLTFVSPILEFIRSNYRPEASGLDFGCGHTPVISEELKDEGYEMDIYDPMFFPEKCFLGRTYDFVICCEVMEHFQNPAREFRLLKGLLNSPGHLVCMTDLYTENLDFDTWYYKNDPTHVFLFEEQSVKYIANSFGFADYNISGRLLVFSNRQ